MSIDSEPSVAGAFVNPYLDEYFAPVRDERHDVGLEVIGEIPEALRGRYLRNGPNPQFTPLGRYHLFDGDGMLHAVELGDGAATYRNRWIESRALTDERRAGHALYGGLSEFVLPPAEVMAEGGMMKNTANTNIVRHGGRILALMEAAHPTEMTADLETVGEYTYGGALAGGMTAHPKWDAATGELHFFGYSPFAPFLRYHVANAAGELVHSAEIEIPRAIMMHDFVVTESSVIFFDLPALFEVESMLAGGAGVRWDAAQGARIGVMPRFGTNAEVRWTEIEPCYVFHFLNAWDEGPVEATGAGASIVIDGCRSSALPISFGDDPAPEGDTRPSLHRWRIDVASGAVTVEQLDDRGSDFPRVNDRFGGRRNRYGYLAHFDPRDDGNLLMNGVTAWDMDDVSSETYVYGPSAAAGEAVFAADPAGTAENDGWLLNIVTDRRDDTSRFVILDARDVAAGPVAEVLLPRRVPFGFHGNWLPDA